MKVVKCGLCKKELGYEYRIGYPKSGSDYDKTDIKTIDICYDCFEEKIK